jgi:small conductance mechanosensitive channel
VYAALLLDIAILRGADVDRAVAIIDRVGTEMQADPDWAPRLLETPRFARVAALGETGVTLRVTGKVRAADRWSVPGELRRRLAIELDAAGIELPTRGRLLVSDVPQPTRPDATMPPGGPDDTPAP